MKRNVKRCYLKQACSANDGADPVVLFLWAAGFVIDEGLFHFRSAHAKSPSHTH
jgi:hypothetical protein